MSPKLKVVLIGSVLFVSAHAAAFDWRRCQTTEVVSRDSASGLTLDGSSSMMQFTSSWGGCSAIGMREERTKFIAENSERVVTDSARGAGEYVEIVAALSGCDLKSRMAFAQAVQSNFELIYQDRIFDLDPDAVGERIDAVIKSEPTLRRSCVPPG